VEIGQGIVTALAQIAADELDVDIGRVQMVRASTAASPNEGVTSGSLSVQQSGPPFATPAPKSGKSFLMPLQIAWASGSMRSTSKTAPSPDPAM
jgi:Xanthine dehydrogenase, molybdopterin-binding subunit B